MKILILTGSHPRHLYFGSKLAELFKEADFITLERENILPSVDHVENSHDRSLLQKHFQIRHEKELEYFESAPKSLYGIKCDRSSFNSELEKYLIKNSPEIVLVFGTSLIEESNLDLMPKFSLNLHLGLSPKYKGSATLFWPFYLMEPNHAGFTFHKISKKIDAGDIVHQGVPKLTNNDGIHDVACKTVSIASNEVGAIVNQIETHGDIKMFPQLKTGKLWLEKDFKPEYLRVNYDLFEDKMVDAYLSGTLESTSPELLSYKSRN